MTTLSVAIGSYPQTRQFTSRSQVSDAALAFADIKPINRAFAPMVREQKFDVSEIAIVTFLQAKAAGKPLVLLPVTIAARFQEAALLCRAADTSITGPADLAGKRIGVRSYSQTTGVWIRGVLSDDFGIAAGQIQWITFEGAHVAEIDDPDFTVRAASGADMLAMLRAGALDAIIVGNDVPDDPDLRTVFPDPKAAGDRFRARHGLMPINHLVTAKLSLAQERPDLVAELVKALQESVGAAGNRDLLAGRSTLEPAISLGLRYSIAQGLVPPSMTVAQVWDGLPSSIG